MGMPTSDLYEVSRFVQGLHLYPLLRRSHQARPRACRGGQANASWGNPTLHGVSHLDVARMAWGFPLRMAFPRLHDVSRFAWHRRAVMWRAAAREQQRHTGLR